MATSQLHEFLKSIPKCDVCGNANDPGNPLFKNRGMLGTDDALCDHCFYQWYSEGIVDKEELKIASLKRRRERNARN